MIKTKNILLQLNFIKKWETKTGGHCHAQDAKKIVSIKKYLDTTFVRQDVKQSLPIIVGECINLYSCTCELKFFVPNGSTFYEFLVWFVILAPWTVNQKV